MADRIRAGVCGAPEPPEPFSLGYVERVGRLAVNVVQGRNITSTFALRATADSLREKVGSPAEAAFR